MADHFGFLIKIDFIISKRLILFDQVVSLLATEVLVHFVNIYFPERRRVD